VHWLLQPYSLDLEPHCLLALVLLSAWSIPY
jgi:hypothetical protein